MNISKSKVKFFKGGNLYTLIEQDTPSKIHIKVNGTVINLSSKADVIANLPNNTLYKDTVNIYYYVNGAYIQLGVYEDIKQDAKVYELTYNNQDGLMATDAIQRDDNFSYLKESNITRLTQVIKYNDSNQNFIIDPENSIEYKANNVNIAPRNTELARVIIDLTSDQNILYNNTAQDSNLGSKLSSFNVEFARNTINLNTGNENAATFDNTVTNIIGGVLTYEEVDPS